MIYLISNYSVEGTTPATLTDLRKFLAKQKIVALDTEGTFEGGLTVLQLGNGYES